MRDVSSNNFGLVIAYLLPGTVTVAGASFFSETVAGWLGASAASGPTVGGFLYATLGSLAAGLTVSTIRWAVVDTINHRTGIPEPEWDFSRLPANLAAFEAAVDNHYRYYQFYGNMLVANAFAFVAWALSVPGWGGGIAVGVLVLEAIFWLGARDALRKYYGRAGALLNGPDPGNSPTEAAAAVPRAGDSPGTGRLSRPIRGVEGPFR